MSPHKKSCPISCKNMMCSMTCKQMGWLVAGIAAALFVYGYCYLGERGMTALFANSFFSAGIFSQGVFSVGNFSIGVFSAGIFSIGIFSIGLFSIGIFAIGPFSVGVFAMGLMMIAKKKCSLVQQLVSEMKSPPKPKSKK